eukprot:1160058-Pelagomonas_calceolata.AAC.1
MLADKLIPCKAWLTHGKSGDLVPSLFFKCEIEAPEKIKSMRLLHQTAKIPLVLNAIHELYSVISFSTCIDCNCESPIASMFQHLHPKV